MYLPGAERSRLEAALAPVSVQPMGEMDNVGDLFPANSELVAEKGSDFATGELFGDADATGALAAPLSPGPRTPHPRMPLPSLLSP